MALKIVVNVSYSLLAIGAAGVGSGPVGRACGGSPARAPTAGQLRAASSSWAKEFLKPTAGEQWLWKCLHNHWNNVNTNKACTNRRCGLSRPDFSHENSTFLRSSSAKKPTVILIAGICGAGKSGLESQDALEGEGFKGPELAQLQKNKFLIDDLVEQDPKYKKAVKEILFRQIPSAVQGQQETDYSFLNAPSKELLEEFNNAYFASRKGQCTWKRMSTGAHWWTEEEKKDRRIFLESARLPLTVQRGGAVYEFKYHPRFTGRRDQQDDGWTKEEKKDRARFLKSLNLPRFLKKKDMRGAEYEIKKYLGLEVSAPGMDGKMNRQMAKVLHNKESLILETTGSGFWLAELSHVIEHYNVEVHWMSVKFALLEDRNKRRAAENAKKFLEDESQGAPRLPNVSRDTLQGCVQANRTQFKAVVTAMKEGQLYSRLMVTDNSQERDKPRTKKFTCTLGQREIGTFELYPGCDTPEVPEV